MSGVLAASGAAGVPGRLELAEAMSRWAGVIRDGAGLGRLAELLGEADAAAQSAAPVRDDDGFDLEAVEAASLRTVSRLIAAGAQHRAESRGCHRRRDAERTEAAPWHTLARFDGPVLVVTEEEL